MAENTIEGLYDDLEDDNIGDAQANLTPGEFTDPDLVDLEDDPEFDEFQGEGSFISEDFDKLEDPGDDTGEGGEEQEEGVTENSIIDDLLKAKGITDPKAIKYENEDGNIEEVDFYGLPYEDQLEILKQDTAPVGPSLSEHETEVVDFMRAQKVSLDDIIDYVKRTAIEEYERETSGKVFLVDDYEDTELFLTDLKLNYEDLTEEELQIQLQKELEHEDLFKKKIAKIRSQYIDLEIKEREFTEANAKDKEAKEFETLSGTLIEAAVALEDIGGISLEDADKNVILSAILEKDLNGKADFYKKLNDPKMLFKAAWFIEKGDEAFAMIHEHYKKTIENVRKTAFAKGKEESTKGAQPKPAKVGFVRPTQTNKQTGKKFMSIDDLS